MLIADDHPVLRRSVRDALESDGFEVCAEADTAASTLEAALREQPDLALLDIHMPGNGISVAAQICDRLPETAVVMLTVSQNDSDFLDALRAGASGYLLKDINPDRLGFALRGVLAGEAALPRTLATRVVEEFRDRSRRRRLPALGKRGVELTSREWEILDLLQHGLTTAEIAERLFISKVTVRRHVSAVLKKLDAPDRKSALRALGPRPRA